MVIEIEKTKLLNMEEDINSYIDLIVNLDKSIKVKNELIKRYEKELNIAKEIIIFLLENNENLNEKEKTELKNKIQ